MSWILHSDEDKAIIAELERESDRGMIIIGVSFLESRLEEIIKLLMGQNLDPEVAGRMFKGIGPLASFSAKIDLGFLFQFYPDEMRLLLHKLRDLRNDAAHGRAPVTFSEQSIKARCEALKTPLSQSQIAGQEHFVRLITATSHMRPSLDDMKPLRAMHDDGTESEVVGYGYGDAKSSFLAAIKSTLLHFHFVWELFHRMQIILPPPLAHFPWRDKPEPPPTPPVLRPSRERKARKRPP